jgi:hypothetical protein
MAAVMRSGGKDWGSAGKTGKREGEEDGLGKLNRHCNDSIGTGPAPPKPQGSCARGAKRNRLLSEK